MTSRNAETPPAGTPLPKRAKEETKEDSPPPKESPPAGSQTVLFAHLSADLKSAISRVGDNDPLVEVQFPAGNSTPAWRRDVMRTGYGYFMDQGPNAAAPPAPLAIPALAMIGDPGVDTTVSIRLSGAAQIANWLADTQTQPGLAAPLTTRMQVRLTSNNGGQWSAWFDIAV